MRSNYWRIFVVALLLLCQNPCKRKLVTTHPFYVKSSTGSHTIYFFPMYVQIKIFFCRWWNTCSFLHIGAELTLCLWVQQRPMVAWVRNHWEAGPPVIHRWMKRTIFRYVFVGYQWGISDHQEFWESCVCLFCGIKWAFNALAYRINICVHVYL